MYRCDSCRVAEKGDFGDFFHKMGGIFHFQNGNSRRPCLVSLAKLPTERAALSSTPLIFMMSASMLR